jgi:hypothetical protein
MVLQLRMIHAETGAVHATYDLTEVFFDPKTRRSAPMPEEVRARLQAHLMPGGMTPEGRSGRKSGGPPSGQRQPLI